MSSHSTDVYPMYTNRVEWDSNGGNVVTNTGSDYIRESYVDYGANYSDWRFRMRNGLDCTTSASGVKAKIKQNSWRGLSISFTHIYVPNYTFGTSVSGHYAHLPDVVGFPAYNSDLRNSSLSSFVARAREVQHRFQGGVFLGELSQTIRLLKRPYDGIRKLTTDYHSKALRLSNSRSSRRSFQKALSEEWLTYRFGIKPLLSDIDDAMYDLASITEGRPPNEPINVRQRDSRVLVAQRTGQLYLYWNAVSVQKIRLSETVQIRGNVRCLLPSINYSGNNALVVAMSDFIPTVWELIPYSFLVDYFTNVGDIVSALTFLESSVNWANITTRQEIESESYADFTLNNTTYGAVTPLQNEDHNRDSMTGSGVRFSRQSLTSFVPSLTFTLPGIGSLKWLNIVALFGAKRSVR